jgi:DNA gyrase subunit A
MERRGGRLVASFPVEDTDGVLLVTDAGQLIRVPVDSIRIAGRNTQGVTILRTAGDERVVSVERVVEPAGSSGEDTLPEGDEPEAI